jgi:hypothetical protein
MTLTNFNDNILSPQLQHNLTEWQWQYFSITIITITSPITTILQWHLHVDYNTISLHYNGNLPQLLCVHLPHPLQHLFTLTSTHQLPHNFITWQHFHHNKCGWFVLQFLLQLCLFLFVTIMLCVPRCSSGISYRLALHGSGSPMCDSLIRIISLCRRRQARHGRRDPAGPEPDR